MINVLIAEDEPSSLRRVRRLILKLDPAFQVVATASDGEEALRRMEEMPCDVVFTDIRMPVMDGLALMDRLREKYPGCMLVVLSGYQDFEYASHAVRAQALDYLVKPVTEEALRPLLKRLRQSYMESRQLKLRQELALNINKAALGASGELKMEDAGDDLQIALFCAGPLPLSGNHEMCPGAALWSHLSLEEVAERQLCGHAAFAWEFMGDTPAERILILHMQKRVPEWAKYLHEAVATLSDLPVTCVSHENGVGLDQVGKALKGLRQLLKQNIFIGRSRFLKAGYDELLHFKRVDAQRFEFSRAERIALMEGGLSAAQRRELFSRFDDEQWTQTQIHDVLMDAVSLLEEGAPPENRPDFAQIREVVTESVSSALSLKALEDDLASMACFGPAPKRTRTNEQENIASEIRDYLSLHYDRHITNQTLAAVFGYVPSYLSILFRRAFGVSPLDYLTEVRLINARRLIESNPDMLMRDVAEKVGFANQHHFSRTFKKYVGLSPTDYKP